MLSRPEQRCIAYLVRRVPDAVTPDVLTATAAAGAAISAASLIGCSQSRWFLATFAVGLALHWLGDSLDGALARLRRCERPRAGLLIDRGCDVLSFCLIILGLGLSPYLQLAPALMLLAAYLVQSIYGLLRTIAFDRQAIGLGGVGATEGRLLLGLWVALAQLAGLDFGAWQFRGVDLFTLAGGLALVFLIGLFVSRIAGDVARLEAGDGAPWLADGSVPTNVILLKRELPGEAKDGRSAASILAAETPRRHSPES